MIKKLMMVITSPPPVFLLGMIYESATVWFQMGRTYSLFDQLSLAQFIVTELRKEKK